MRRHMTLCVHHDMVMLNDGSMRAFDLMISAALVGVESPWMTKCMYSQFQKESHLIELSINDQTRQVFAAVIVIVNDRSRRFYNIAFFVPSCQDTREHHHLRYQAV